MTFEELGALLRSEREKRCLSIDRVADELKINARILAALESGDSTRLPPPAYTRGFIRTYSSYLGFSGDEIHNMTDAVELKYIPRNSRNHARTKTQPESSDSKTPRQRKGNGALYAGVIVIALLGGGGYWLWSSGYIPWPAIKKEAKINSIEQLPSADAWQPHHQQNFPQPEAVPDVIPTPRVDEMHASSPSNTPAPEDTPAASAEPQNTASDNSIASGEDKKNIATNKNESGEEKKTDIPTHHKLIITATEECWVHSRADKTDTRQFSLRKGDTFALTFAKSLELKLGNAGGVALRYDGKELPPPGTSGQVKSLIFPLKENND